MSSNAYNIIRAAIEGRENIRANYKGFPREMTPHTLGLKKGREHCLFYQFGGASSSATTFPDNSPQNWRCVFVDDLEGVAAIGGEFHTCDQHGKTQTCVDQVDIEATP